MKINTLSKLAYKHAQSAFQEEVYLKTKVDMTRPVKIYGIINERCNFKCRYCEYWRLEHYQDELPIDEWKSGLASLKDFLGSYHIEFSGGEPFIKKGFLDLLEWCHEQNITFGVTTNGSALKPKIITRFLETHPFNMNVSVDSNNPEIHDHMRGIPGSLKHLLSAIPQLREEQARLGINFPVIIKPTVCAPNFRQLPEMVEWATRDLGGTIINFQPVDRWTSETYDELWIEKKDHADLQAVVNELIQMKRDGLPIMNSELTMNLWVKHYLEEKAPESAMPCRVGLRNYFIRSNGDVEVCWYWPPIGNIKSQTAEEIWQSAEARKRREETTACDRLCLFSCLSANTLQDKVKIGMKLLFEDSKKSKS
jgi:radical SAM protein with 4Fe4S-binding SPASM domain